MQAPLERWNRTILARACPSVGCLTELSEENYAALLALIPDLSDRSGRAVSRPERATNLILEVIEQAPYTTLVRLTHHFPHPDAADGEITDPNALLRVYHDARQVDVLDLRQTALPIYNHYSHPALMSKWRVGLFLSKWLSYCRKAGYGFGHASMSPTGEPELASSAFVDG